MRSLVGEAKNHQLPRIQEYLPLRPPFPEQVEALQREFPHRTVFTEVHRPSGAFSHPTFLNGFTNVYDNVTNILVLVPGYAPDEEQRTVTNRQFQSFIISKL